jgi:(p)ppGpp synthase/HD superfamily hydrolase
LIFDPREKLDFDTALSLALQVHHSQKDKDGEPYILHPIRVAQRMTSPFLRIAALLHDTLEDVDPLMLATTEGEIRSYFGENLLSLVRILTRSKGQSYNEYIEELSHAAPARVIKIADLEDNLKPSREKNGWHMPTEMRVRYERELGVLRTIDAASRVVPDQGVMKNRGDLTTSTS